MERIEFQVEKNDRGLYTKVGGKFALIDRRHLDRVAEGERWRGRIEREITDRRGNRVPIVVPEERLLKIATAENLEKAVFSGRRELFLLEEGVKRGAVEFAREEKLYDWRPGYRKEMYRIVPSPYGVPDPKGMTDYDRWPYVEPLRLSEILEEKEYVRERFREQAERGKEVERKLWQMEKEIKKLEKEIKGLKELLEEPEFVVEEKKTTYDIWFDGKKAFQREIRESDVSEGWWKQRTELYVTKVPVEVPEEKLKEYREIFERKLEESRNELRELEKRKADLEREYKELEQENREALGIYDLFTEAKLNYLPATCERYTFTDDWFVLPEYLYRALMDAKKVDDEEVLEKVEEILGRVPETPQGLAFGLALAGRLYGIKPESLDLEQFEECYFEGPEDAGEAFLEEVEKLWKDKVEPRLENGTGIEP